MKKINFKKEFGQIKSSTFSNILDDIKFKEIIENESVNWQENIYPPRITLEAFIKQVLNPDHSCKKAVAEINADRVSLGEEPGTFNTGPYCKARQRLSEDMIKKLALATGARLNEHNDNNWKWKGRDVKLADGTTMIMPDTTENQAKYPQSESQSVGCGFPIARCVAVTSLSVGTVLGIAIGSYAGKETGEHALFRDLMHLYSEGDVMLADRYYCSYYLIAEMLKKGVDVVVQIHASRKHDFRKGVRLGEKDHIVKWERPNRKSWMSKEEHLAFPEEITIRETYIKGKVIVSTLLDEKEITKKDIQDLYDERWSIESDLRSIKETMQMDMLRCKSPSMVRKEIYTHLLAYNLIRIVMAQAAELKKTSPRSISFKGACQVIDSFRPILLRARRSSLGAIYKKMLIGIACDPVGNRPGRSEPRVIKRTKTKYAKMTKHRKQYKK